MLVGKEAAVVPEHSERERFVTLRGSSSIMKTNLDEEDTVERPLFLG